jgi:hypothetical protein
LARRRVPPTKLHEIINFPLTDPVPAINMRASVADNTATGC